MSQQFLAPLSAYMGQLLGPKPVAEIVITLYENQQVNFQIEGMNGPVEPADAYKLLRIVMQEITRTHPIPQEAPQTHE